MAKNPNQSTNSVSDNPELKKWEDFRQAVEADRKIKAEAEANKRFNAVLEARNQRLEKDPNTKKRSSEEEEAYLDNLLKEHVEQPKPKAEFSKTEEPSKTEKTEPEVGILEDPSTAGALTAEEIDALLNGLPEEKPAEENLTPTEKEVSPETAKNVDELKKAWEDLIGIDEAINAAKVTTNTRPLEFSQAKEAELQQNQEMELVQAQEAEKEEAKEAEKQKNVEELRDAYAEYLELERIRQNVKNYHDTELELLEVEEEIAKEKNRNQPLVAINADWTHDKREIAHDLAEQTINAEVAKGGLISKIWKGTLFKKYYEKKYEKEFLSGERTNKEGKTLYDIVREESPAVMERFVLGAVEEESRYIHSLNGEKLQEADNKTTKEIRHAIEKYARTKLKKGNKVSDLDRKFENDVDRIIQEAIDNGRINEGSKDNNYLEVAKEAARRYKEVAINAKNKAEHDKAMAEVMAGFKVYNAEVRNNVRTEAHRDNIDKIVNKLESSKIGQFIPAEIIAGAAGAAVALTQTGARAAFGAVGGVVASSAIAGLRERNRITEDRARMLRDVANGMDYNSENKKLAKHEQRIGGTLYDMQKATDLTARIKEAIEYDGKDRGKVLMQAIAEARVRIDFSDSEQKDLISYSSDQDRGRERLELDKILIKAERSLTNKGKRNYQDMQDLIRQKIIEGYEDEAGEYHAGVEELDQKFKNYRTIAAVKKAGKTLALGSAIFLGSQEVMAAIDPSKIGIFEKAGLLKTDNAKDAKETLLASGFGQFRGSYEVTGSNTEIRASASDPEAIKKYEADGYKKLMMTKKAWSETKTDIESVDPSASSARVDVKYDGWANNGTKIADGNEIRGQLLNGKFISNLKGTSTFNGQTFDYNPSSVKAYITIGDSKFEIAGKLNESGQLTWGENGVFTTTTGETIKAVGDNGEKLYKYFEIAADNGVDANGVQHIVPLATDVGKNTFSGTIDEVVKTSIDHPAVYTLVKEIPGKSETFVRGISTNGFAFAPELGRTGLGEVNAPEPSLRATLESAPEESVEVMPESPIEVEISEPAPAEPAPAEPESASEPTPTASETISTPENSSDFENWNNEIQNEIRDSVGLIGEEGVSALTDTGLLNEERQERWRKWWRELSQEGKNRVEELGNRIHESGYAYDPKLKWGNAFLTWLMLNT